VTGIVNADFDKFARAILERFDYRTSGVAALVVCIALSIVRQIRSRTRPSLAEFLSGVLGILGAFTGVTVAIIFLLTKPPAIEYLSGDGLILAGITTLVASVYLGWTLAVTIFLPPKPPSFSQKPEAPKEPPEN
jgi:hypothetical protein